MPPRTRRTEVRPIQPFAVFPCMSQASLGPFPQNLSFELGEYCKQAGHGMTTWRDLIQRLS
jgi:hypothetical protein